MPHYSNIKEFINQVPKFMHPEYLKSLRLLYSHLPEYRNQELWTKIVDDIPLNIFIKLRNNDWNQLENYLIVDCYNKMASDNRFVMSLTIYDKEEVPEIPEDLIMCDNCGNVWDGYAQCMCLWND
jgi:hypothetical protein